MKALHHTDYWSAETERNNIWCRKPEGTVAFMEDLQLPCIAYKTLAAGAIGPEVGFKYAFGNGADFLCVGMGDFQIAQDAKIVPSVLGSKSYSVTSGHRSTVILPGPKGFLRSLAQCVHPRFAPSPSQLNQPW